VEARAYLDEAGYAVLEGTFRSAGLPQGHECWPAITEQLRRAKRQGGCPHSSSDRQGATGWLIFRSSKADARSCAPSPVRGQHNLHAPEIAPRRQCQPYRRCYRTCVTMPSTSDGRGRRFGTAAVPAYRSYRPVRHTCDLGVDERFRAIAERDGLLHVELLEKSLAAYESEPLRENR